METQFVRPKYLISLLIVLLIAVAFVAAFTFDGGKLRSFIPGLNQPAAESLEQNQLVPVSGSSLDSSSPANEYSSPNLNGCYHTGVERPEDY